MSLTELVLPRGSEGRIHSLVFFNFQRAMADVHTVTSPQLPVSIVKSTNSNLLIDFLPISSKGSSDFIQPTYII